jgi:hypothetical protein
MRSIPRLRGHHLICLHFFNGKGYSPEFTKNLRTVLRVAAESGVEVSQGADDVCRACPYLKDEKCMYDEHSDEEITEMDGFALKLLHEAPGIETEWHLIKERVLEIFPLWLERYCKKCSWEKACEENPLYQTLR